MSSIYPSTHLHMCSVSYFRMYQHNLSINGLQLPKVLTPANDGSGGTYTRPCETSWSSTSFDRRSWDAWYRHTMLPNFRQSTSTIANHHHGAIMTHRMTILNHVGHQRQPAIFRCNRRQFATSEVHEQRSDLRSRSSCEAHQEFN